MPKYVSAFSEGAKEHKDLLGGKGANLAEMTNLDLPVPPGFTITTEACVAYLERGGELPEGLLDQVDAALTDLEGRMGRRLGDPADPLLVSVRSGAPFSMPGMMDTVLNLGLGADSVEGLAGRTGNERFARDSHRRFVQMFAKIVLGVDPERFERRLEQMLRDRGVEVETELGAADLAELVAEFEGIVHEVAGVAFPSDPREQLRRAIEAVFESWNSKRAQDYRRLEGIPDHLGTAVNVQAMVFGNTGDDSGTGVAFTRDPATGEDVHYGDFLPNAQGEDVVAGIRNPLPLAAMRAHFPEPHEQLSEVLDTLERHYRDMCDVEFTIEAGRLWVLQTRVGKRSAAAALRIAVDMEHEGMIDRREAVARVRPQQLDQLLHPQFAPDAVYEPLTRGLNASPGAAVGRVCFRADDAEARHATGEAVILVRPETSPDDLHGMIAAEGILTARGGLVSHAAVVARGMGKPAVCGADALRIDAEAGRFTVGEVVVEEGDVISMSGTTGEVVLGAVALVHPEPGPHFEEVLGWADGLRSLGVRTNADLPEDAARARAFGAEGIGLCRTEHMFLGDRLPLVQRMILADGDDEEAAALEELGRVQRADFEEILEVMDGLPVTVRLLDPPLHEFLPDHEELAIAAATGELDDEGRRLLAAAEHWQETNPMLGTRGCRLAVLRPGLYRMQVRALAEAAVERHRVGGTPRFEVMIPLAVTRPELALLVGWVRDEVDGVLRAAGVALEYRVGTMVETPRAALDAGEVAAEAEFFSFGTNDLTQMTFGFSRDDVEGRFIPTYLAAGLLEANPFETLDVDGVGRLVRIAVTEGRATRPGLKLGICGEHGGDPASVAFCHDLGLDYVSCSPYRVPIARLAAAHAALATGGPGSTA